jgi:hypothetical protein
MEFDEQFIEDIPQLGIGGFLNKTFKKVKKAVKKIAPIAGAGLGFIMGGAAGAGIGAGIGGLIAGQKADKALKTALMGYGIGSLAGAYGPLKGFAGKGFGASGKFAMGDNFNVIKGAQNMMNKFASVPSGNADNVSAYEKFLKNNNINLNDPNINMNVVNDAYTKSLFKGSGKLGFKDVLSPSTVGVGALAGVGSYMDALKQQNEFVPGDPNALNALYYNDPQEFQLAGQGVKPYYYTDMQDQFGVPIEELTDDFVRYSAQGGIIKKRHEGSPLRGEFSGSPHTEGPFYRGDDEGTSPNVPYDQMQKDQMMGYLMMQFSENPSAFEQQYGNEMAEFFRQMMGFKTKKQVESDTGAIFDENSSEIIGYNLAQGGIINLADGSKKYFPRKNGEIEGPGTGTSDDIPAMLSDGEFVFTAKAVNNAGGGNRREGAKRMYQMMKNLEKGGTLSEQSRGVA